MTASSYIFAQSEIFLTMSIVDMTKFVSLEFIIHVVSGAQASVGLCCLHNQ